MLTIIAIVISYFIGSVSSAIIISRLFGLDDPRKSGSGNAGATNVLRLSGKKVAAYVLAGDLVKGILAIYISLMMGVDGFALGLAGIAVVLGHIFPVFFQFKGGKGVATGAGVVLGLSLWIGLLAVITWVVVAAIWRYASLASVAACIAVPIFMLIFQHANYFIPTLVIALVIIWRHLDNIKRWRNGTEKKIFLKQ